MEFFKYFKFKDIYVHCANYEIQDSFDKGHVDSLLVLLQWLDIFREYLNMPIIINSGYRSPVHNASVGGSANSQHMLGEAVDFKVIGLSIDAVYLHLKDWIKDAGLESVFGQIIIYPSFIHLALSCTKYSKTLFYDKRKCKNNH